MQKFYRLSSVILIVSLVLLTAPPAQAVHVIAAAVDFQPPPYAITNTGDVYLRAGGGGGTWVLIGTVPGAFGFSGFNFDGGAPDIWLLSLQGNAVSRSLVNGVVIGPAVFLGAVCSGAPIRSFSITALSGTPRLTTVHEDGTICIGSIIVPGPGDPVAVEETTWGTVKDTYKFKD